MNDNPDDIMAAATKAYLICFFTSISLDRSQLPDDSGTDGGNG